MVLEACGAIDGRLSTDSGDLACLMGGTDDMPERLRELLAACDYAAGWLSDPDGSLRSTLRGAGVPNTCLKPVRFCPGLHQSERFLEGISEGRSLGALSSHLVIPETLRETGRRVLQSVAVADGQDYAVCHPGSGSRHKCIPAETMAQAIDGLRHNGVIPVVVGGPADDEAVDRVRKLCADVPVIQKQDLMTMAGVLAGCRLYIGHDSGLTHLAGAMQIPTIAIFGPTDPRQWAPLGGHVCVLVGHRCFCPTWADVTTCLSKSCLSVSASAVIEACRSMLSGYPSVTRS